MMSRRFCFSVIALALATVASAETAVITVNPDQPGHSVSRYLTASCIEDVNHEIYGGIYSQMVFGESFQEPAPVQSPKGFDAFDGAWNVEQGELHGSAGDGPKLISQYPPFADGEVTVEVFFADAAPGNAGLIVRTSAPGKGADAFDGYEVSLDTAGMLRPGRHRHNWTLIKDAPCSVPTNQWILLTVRLNGPAFEIAVNGKTIIQHTDGAEALLSGSVGLRQWKRAAAYRNLQVTTNGKTQTLDFIAPASVEGEISGQWRLVQRGSASGRCTLEQEKPFLGAQSQRLVFEQGEGVWGIENRGLNRWGMNYVEGKPYEGVLWARAEKAITFSAILEDASGARTYAETRLNVQPGDWQRLTFTMTPNASDAQGRFTLALTQPGAIDLGYAFLQPGAWGRFKDLPVRRDVAEGLIDQGITLLRYGGSMINHAGYRWKNMIGPRDQRLPYHGTWYPYSSNGWGIADFMNLCEAAGFEYIPAFNMDETPRDMADFVRYALGPADSEWGRKRVEDGHPAPYALRIIELGNEERVDDNYVRRFIPMAEAIWAEAPGLILTVGDFVYTQPIRDPYHFEGCMSGVTTLEAHRQILECARAHNAEVWFDVHVGTDGPRPDPTFNAMWTYADALEKLVPGAKCKTVIYEFNAGNHTQRRALANALAINAIRRDGRIPVSVSANGLQPDGQNDNGWDQGLLFLNPAQVWLQPPGWVARMIARHYQPQTIPVRVEGNPDLDVSATRSEDGKAITLFVVNSSENQAEARLDVQPFMPAAAEAIMETLSAPLDAVNTANAPTRVMPQVTDYPYPAPGTPWLLTFPPHAFMVIALH